MHQTSASNRRQSGLKSSTPDGSNSATTSSKAGAMLETSYDPQHKPVQSNASRNDSHRGAHPSETRLDVAWRPVRQLPPRPRMLRSEPAGVSVTAKIAGAGASLSSPMDARLQSHSMGTVSNFERTGSLRSRSASWTGEVIIGDEQQEQGEAMPAPGFESGLTSPDRWPVKDQDDGETLPFKDH